MHRIYLLREHHLHGIVTGMEAVRIMSSVEDGLDRLLVSFKDAKVCGFATISPWHLTERLACRLLSLNGHWKLKTLVPFRFIRMNERHSL